MKSVLLVGSLLLSFVLAPGVARAEIDPCTEAAQTAGEKLIRSMESLDYEIGEIDEAEQVAGSFVVEYTVNEVCVDAVVVRTRHSRDGQRCEVTEVKHASPMECD